ncbi:MAG: ATP-dependent DNA helicase RecG [Fusobacteriaceae bacterium]|nr:ATP-dependent DNA helicase RecG [Fusobacteriaceae bacterium]MBN2838327.1 ATP-dependent DNA helicase RecG [Fusobacteriaceae bacterium]
MDDLKSYNLLFEEIKDFEEKDIKKLKKLGVKSYFDLLYNFPRAYEDRTNIKKISEVTNDEFVIIKATVIRAEMTTSMNRRKLFKAKVTDGTGYMELTWFGMPYAKNYVKEGNDMVFIGQVKRRFGFQMVNPEFKVLKGESVFEGEILPIYSLVNGVQENDVRKLVKWSILHKIELVEENLPREILEKYKILGRKKAIRCIHFPKNNKEIEDAKRRFAIEELIILQFGILKSKFLLDENKRFYNLEDKKELVKKFIGSLKFELTTAQKKVITEVHKDLSNGKIVNRLIQGDVGSGKTIVAEILLLYMVENNYQGVLMAPTEILAVQHYLSMIDELGEQGVKVEILTGSIKGKKRKEILSRLREGDIDILIGTHALIEDEVEFHNLGLTIIDEQHRFGVEQRRKLREKGSLSNLLVMSATPIPRSLALSIYGDLDLSVIDELPPGRTPIRTKCIKDNIEKNKMYDFIRKKLRAGDQAYIVAPLIEESETLNVKSVEELYEELSNLELKGFNLAILHGKMSNQEKDEIMHKFKNGDIDVLVSTTVIEVGVNVPNSTIMVINDAHRFGLSALHQLRGRVGRGSKKAYCFLVSSSTNDNSVNRLEVLEKTNDGFVIAEEDLKFRKSGEIFGKRQSGLSDLRFTDITTDVKTVKLVRDIAIEYLKINKGKITNEFLIFDINKKFDEKKLKG